MKSEHTKFEVGVFQRRQYLSVYETGVLFFPPDKCCTFVKPHINDTSVTVSATANFSSEKFQQ